MLRSITGVAFWRTTLTLLSPEGRGDYKRWARRETMRLAHTAIVNSFSDNPVGRLLEDLIL